MATIVKRGCDVYDVDTDEGLHHFIKTMDLKIDIGPFEAKNYKQDYFDYVILDQIIEYMLDPMETLSEIEKVLKPNGVLVLSTPNVFGWGLKVLDKLVYHISSPSFFQQITTICR